ncbi:acyltransferase [Candidiatus Paracoxiella cheracis]|uniref:acyltransferase n=1 Tax=Candidiatus Paracoxiella cheracis TaxID=3405120 RepID=UPI003BF54AB8
MKFLKSFTAAIYMIFFGISSVLSVLSIYVAFAISWLIPIRWWRYRLMKIAQQIPVIWASSINVILYINTRKKWDIQGTVPLSTKNWYMLISNHQTWADIPALGYVFNYKTPTMKFFMKKELLWSLPIVGLGCWILGYPFMVRHSREDIRKNPELRGKDIDTTKSACNKFKEYPTTIMNFIEGTRFTEQKRQRRHSPYKHLLSPKAGGLAIVINEMKDYLAGILDVTIEYSEPKMTFWKLVTGNFQKATVIYRLLPITDDLLGEYYENREFRKHFQQWLNGIWEQKDHQLDILKQ